VHAFDTQWFFILKILYVQCVYLCSGRRELLTKLFGYTKDISDAGMRDILPALNAVVAINLIDLRLFFLTVLASLHESNRLGYSAASDKRLARLASEVSS